MRFVRLAYCYDQCEVFELLAERVIQIGKVHLQLLHVSNTMASPDNAYLYIFALSIALN